MGIFSVILLITRILFTLPKMISVGAQIIALLKTLKDTPFIGDIKTIIEILKLILDLIPKNKELATNAFVELHSFLKSPHLMGGQSGLEEIRDRLRREQNSTVAHGSQPVSD